MKLIQYMRTNGLSHKDVTDALGLGGISTVYRYISGERTPSRRIMQRIYEMTRGQVTANDFMDFAAPEQEHPHETQTLHNPAPRPARRGKAGARVPEPDAPEAPAPR